MKTQEHKLTDEQIITRIKYVERKCMSIINNIKFRQKPDENDYSFKQSIKISWLLSKLLKPQCIIYWNLFKKLKDKEKFLSSEKRLFFGESMFENYEYKTIPSQQPYNVRVLWEKMLRLNNEEMVYKNEKNQFEYRNKEIKKNSPEYKESLKELNKVIYKITHNIDYEILRLRFK